MNPNSRPAVIRQAVLSAKAGKPASKVAFIRNSARAGARTHVRNSGADGTVRMEEGAISQQKR